MSKPVLMIGSGGHASVLLDVLQEQRVDILGYVDPRAAMSGGFALLQHWTADEDVLQHAPEDIELVLGIGSLPGNGLRKKMYDKFKALGYRFRTVVADSAVVSPSAVLDEGVQLMPGCVVNAHAHIGCNSIINTRASIDHDCKVGAHNHVAPGAVLCGTVRTGAQVHVGTSACVIQAVSIGNDVVVGAGATVTSDVPEHMTVYPARSTMKQHNFHEDKA